MKKVWQYSLFGVLALALMVAVLVALTVWALNSAEGTRAFLKAVSIFSPVGIEAKEISGRLGDELKIRGLRLRWTQGEVLADSFHLRWEAAELWKRRVRIHELALEGVQIKDNRPPAGKTSFEGWPQAPFWLSKLKGEVESLRIQKMLYLRANGISERVDDLSATLFWSGDFLRVPSFLIESPRGRVSGSMTVGFAQPGLNLDLRATSIQEWAGWDSLGVELLLEPVPEQEQAKGILRMWGEKDSRESLRCEAELALSRTALSFSGLRLFHPGRKGVVQAEGQIVFSTPPRLWLKVEASEIGLPPEWGLATDLYGRAEVKGSADKYDGQITFNNRLEGWRRARGAAVFRGSRKKLEITKLEASWLHGSIQGPLTVSWAEGVEVRGKIQARGLDISALKSEWQGEVNINLEGRFRSPGVSPPEASFRLNLLESRLFEKSLRGKVEGKWREKLLTIDSLHLHGQGFDLKGKGILQERLALEAGSEDLAAFIPGAMGRMAGSGWIRYREKHLSGMMAAEGKDLMIKDIAAGNLRAEFHLEEGDTNSAPYFSLGLRAGNLRAGSLNIPALDFHAAGTFASHRAKFAFVHEKAGIRGELAGAYARGLWKGNVVKVDGWDARGAWSLLRPAPIAFSASRFRLSPLILRSGRGESLKVQADLSLHPASGSLETQWRNVDLARANPWMRWGSVSGESSGSFSARGQKAGWHISGESRFRGALTHGRLRIEVSSGDAALRWDEKGLLGEATLKLSPGGIVRGSVSSSESFAQILPKGGRFEARWEEIRLEILGSFLPPQVLLRGKNSGKLSGEWFEDSHVEAAGKAELSQGGFVWKGGRKPISVSLDRAEASFSWKGEGIQGEFTIASVEYGNIEGKFLLPLTAALAPSFNPEGPFMLSLQGKLEEKEILSSLYPEWIQKSRAKVELGLKAGGTFKDPRLQGEMRISDAELRTGKQIGGKEKDRVIPLPALEVPSVSATLDWGPQGLRGILQASLKADGTVEGAVTSSEPARLAFPRQGNMEIFWRQLSLQALQPLLPERFFGEGRVNGQMRGAWSPGFRFHMAGGFKAGGGILSWRGEEGLISAGIQRADLDFLWQGDGVQGNIFFALADYGFLQGHFRLPLPAHPPFRFVPAGSVRVSVQGQVQERGLIPALFPGIVEESRGQVNLDLSVAGTWENPDFQGTLHLRKAGAYLPSLGIRVEDLSSLWRWRGERVQIESFHARSGPGKVEGTGTLWLKHWAIERFEGHLEGEGFQVLYLPNLRVRASPRLQIAGTPRKISVGGEILVPEAQIYEVSGPGIVRTSSDVVLTDRVPQKSPRFSTDIQVRVILGDRIQVKAAGVEARLAGNLDLKMVGWQPEKRSARGEVRLVEGFYSGYGLRLRIERGRFIYAGGPVDNPDLDILALRRPEDLEKFADVKVGLAVFGNLKNPRVKLYSQPAMKDEEILSYLILGRPYDPKEGNLSLLLAGAGGLLSGGSRSPLERLSSQVGIDTVDIQSGGEGFSRSMVTLGKYVTPELYVSYGYGVFSEEQRLKVRYRISKNWEVETWRGTAMGIDLYYRIDFY